MRRIMVGLCFLVMLTAGLPARAEYVFVLAAASLQNALDDAVQDFDKTSGDNVRVSYGASSALAKQIENAAPADIFISADLDWMDYVEKAKMVKPGTRANLLANKLVLVAPADHAVPVAIAANFPLAQRLGADGRLAMADPDSVPAGKYGKGALENLGVWNSVENRIARAEDVRAALRLVARGEAPLGIVYATDAAAEPGVKIVGTFPDSSYKPIIYPIAQLTSGTSAHAGKFEAYLRSDKAAPFFVKQGFAVLK
jgi:molybdate transport system substrate-binding protein